MGVICDCVCLKSTENDNEEIEIGEHLYKINTASKHDSRVNSLKKQSKANSNNKPNTVLTNLCFDFNSKTLVSKGSKVSKPSKVSESNNYIPTIPEQDEQVTNQNYNTTNITLPTTKHNSKNDKGKVNITFDKSNFISLKSNNILDQYKFIDYLGKGSYGCVYKAKHKEIELYSAIKKITKSLVDSSFYNETQILKTLDHPNIIKLIETYQDEHNYYLVEEYCAGGDLYDFIKKQKSFSEKKAANIIFQILKAVNYLHANKIVHRDLKPENIVIVTSPNKGRLTNNLVINRKNDKSFDMSIKLIDFGTSTRIQGRKLRQELGTIYYIAPEVFKGSYDEKCDIWSCGIILYTIFCGFPPVRSNKEEDIKKKIIENDLDYTRKEWMKVSKEARDFVKSLLNYDPIKRPSAAEAMKSSWLVNTLKSSQDNMLDNDIMTNLIKFHSTIVLEKAVLAYLTGLTDNIDQTILKEFEKIDKNGDGLISKDELFDTLQKYYPEIEAEKMVTDIFKQVDFNDDGFLSYTEFMSVNSKNKKQFNNEMFKKAFEMFDLDGNGYITKEELAEKFPAKIEVDDTWENIINKVDKDGDGRINFEEFVEMMENFLNQTNDALSFNAN